MGLFREGKVAWRPHGNVAVSAGACREAGEGLWIRNCSDRTKSNGCKLKEGKASFGIRKKFFSVIVERYWNREISNRVRYWSGRLWMPQAWSLKASLDKAFRYLA